MHFLIKMPPFDAMMQNGQGKWDRLARLDRPESVNIRNRKSLATGFFLSIFLTEF